MPTSIGQIIANDPQLQEFAERCLSQVFDLCRYGDLMADDICEDMGITEDEMYWMFEQLGYSREERNNMRKWMNVELSREKFEEFRKELRQAGIKYEPSSHGHLVHVEVYCSKDEETYLNAILDGLEE